MPAFIDPMHAARLAQLEGALCALLRAAGADHEPNDVPDAIAVRLDSEGVDIEYQRGGLPVAGEAI
jgi:hypothetical protein